MNPSKPARCAIYTRVSTEEQANKDFSSLDAQRQFCEQHIQRKANDGWKSLPQRYDDPGFSGKNLRRPALQKLIQDVEVRLLDKVVVYKFDRLSRNQMECLQLLDLFKSNGVDFVAVSQPVDSSTSSGWFTSSLFMGLSQMERMQISERVTDKIRASKEKGLWMGGNLPLGYAPNRKKRLIINPVEAEQVREMFRLYTEEQSLDRALRKVNARYQTKRWTAANGNAKGGRSFDKTGYLFLLKNRLYVGETRHKDRWHKGEHKAIVEPDTFEAVQKLLIGNRVRRRSDAKNKHEYLLKGLVACIHCGSAMTTHFNGGRNRDYRYYRCESTMKRGYDSCQVKWVKADILEGLVVERLAFLSDEKGLVERAIQLAQEDGLSQLPVLREALKRHQDDLKAVHRDADRILKAVGLRGSANSLVAERLDQLDQRKHELEEQMSQIVEQVKQAEQRRIEPGLLRRVLADFGRAFQRLGFLDRRSLVQLAVQSVRYDGLKKKSGWPYGP